MRSLDELRRELAAETADLVVDLPPGLISRRVRQVRTRRATVALAGVLAVAAVATPIVVLGGGTASAPIGVTPTSSAPPGPSAFVCPTPLAAGTTIDLTGALGPGEHVLGPFVSTGVTFEAPNLNTEYDVLLGFTGTPDDRSFAVVFRDRQSGASEPWDRVGLAPDANGDIQGKTAADPSLRFFSEQLVLGAHQVLDLGIYTRSPHRVTVASEGRGTDAQTRRHAETGWTLFWTVRDAAPMTDAMPVTVTAYDVNGGVQDAVIGGAFVAVPVQNPRDHGFAPPAARRC